VDPLEGVDRVIDVRRTGTAESEGVWRKTFPGCSSSRMTRETL
jgi:hypothetical protein